MSETSSTTFEKTLRLLLRPIARLMIANDFQLPRFLELTKQALIDEAQTKPASTDSYISLKTGVHRKDVKRLREMDVADRDLPVVATPIAAILSCWTQDAAFRDAQGHPRPLSRRCDENAVGFDALVQQAKIDVPPATVLAELLQQGIIKPDANGKFVLLSDTYIPTLGDAVLNAFQATLIEHLNLSVANAISDTPQTNEFDRVLRYSHLSQASIDELGVASRKGALAFLEGLNRLAHDLQKRDDAGTAPATGRFSTGVFIAPNPIQLKKVSDT